jgi:hypothetical protein
MDFVRKQVNTYGKVKTWGTYIYTYIYCACTLPVWHCAVHYTVCSVTVCDSK